MKRSTIIMSILMITICQKAWSQTNKHLEELGKEYNINTIKKWSESNDGTWFTNKNKPRFNGVLLPKYGQSYGHDFNKVNGATVVTNIEFGTAAVMSSRYSHLESGKTYNGYSGELPFGLRIGMSLAEVETVSGTLSLSNPSGYPGEEILSVSNLPGFRGLQLIMSFEGHKLVYMKIEIPGTYTEFNQYKKRLKEESHPMKMSLSEAIKEKSLTGKKIYFNGFSDGLKVLFAEEEKNETDKESPELMQLVLKRDFGVDSVFHVKNEGYTAVWCTAGIKDKEAFYDELIYYLNATLESRIWAGFDHLRVKDYYSDRTSSQDYFYRHPDEGSGFRQSNSHLLFHAYMLKETNEMVFKIIEPGTRNSVPSSFIGVCKPSNPDLLLSDEEYLVKNGIDIDALKVKFAKYPGNAFFRVMDGKRRQGEYASGSGIELNGGYNEKTGNSWQEGITFKFDKGYSSSVFKGNLPLGFKRGMSISKIKTILPGYEYKKWHAKENWYTTYFFVKVTDNVNISYSLSFRKGKLGRMKISMNESEANSRDWQLLRSKIFPELND